MLLLENKIPRKVSATFLCSNFFCFVVQDEFVEMMEITNPDKMDISERRQSRLEKEYSMFSAERY